MTHLKNKVVLTEEDYDLLTRYVRPSDKPDNTMSLAYELGRAKVVKRDEIEKERVKINSSIKIKDLDTQIITSLTIVSPDHADVKHQKISVLTPIGSALIGFKEGDEVEWKMPVGIKRYVILDVS
ncbi:hypothetical protein GCM10023231_26740 [Olivibacter ginsenosidimutans]|uniref:Transcription elongation factor GreA/GreB C-terminal domain-containing protein n=1 Tax=Olivibacter ginsenosidimutans TaxID=1176537 RepID=A0ABP9BN70_9SPHI